MIELPAPDVLRDLGTMCRHAEKGDRRLDCLIWVELGWTYGTDEDLAWRRHQHLAPGMIVNAMTMREAIKRYPDDMEGIGVSWNVPLLSTSRDAAEMLLGEPENPFVWSTMNDFGGLRRVHVFDGAEVVVNADAASIPLAILAATLKASAMRIEQGLHLPERL